VVKTFFSLWDRAGRDPHLLIAMLELFNYDLDFLSDITTCCELLEFQRTRRDIADVFGV